jgi:hypothetical protein
LLFLSLELNEIATSFDHQEFIHDNLSGHLEISLNSIWSNLGKIHESSIFIWSSTKTVHLSSWGSWKLSLFRKGRCLELQGICLSYVTWMAAQGQPMKVVSSFALAQLCKLWTLPLHGWILCSTYKQTSIIDAISSSFKSTPVCLNLAWPTN